MERVTSRILIAEDDPAVASVPDEGLSASGFAATVVGDGRDALSAPTRSSLAFERDCANATR